MAEGALRSPELIGRAPLVAAAVRQLEHGTRLLTLTGRRGVGTTRLALSLAPAQSLPVAVVPLDDAVDEADYLARTLDALSLSERTEAAVVARLREQQHVLVLDGCRAVAEARRFVQALLDQVDDVSLVVTSPQALGLAEEQVIVVPPLDLPSPDERYPETLAASPSVALFLASAALASPGVVLTDEDLATIAEVCRRLDGLPEAILLASSRLGLMQPAAMLTEMSRLGAWELVGLSVQDELERSIALLDPAALAVLLALATVAGGARLDAVAAVAGEQAGRDVVGVLSLLVDLRVVNADTVHARYALTSSATEYVRARFADDVRYADAAARHAHFFAEQARAFARRPQGSLMDPAWLLDHHNRLTALSTIRAAGDRSGALRLTVDSMRGFEQRGEPETGRRLLSDVLSEVPESRSGACIQAHIWLGRLEAERADGVNTLAASTHLETAVRLARERGHLIAHLDALNAICENQWLLEDGVEQAERAVEEGLALTADPGLAFGRGVFLCWHATNLHRRGRLQEAADAIGEALTIARAFGDRRLVMSFAIIHWGLPAEVRRHDFGVPSLPEMLEMAVEQGDVRARGWVLANTAALAIEVGDHLGAVTSSLDLLRFARRTHQRPLARYLIVNVIRLLDRFADPERLALLVGALARHATTILPHTHPRFVVDLERAIATARGALGDARFETVHSSGVPLDIWTAVDLAEQSLLAMRDRVTPTGLRSVPSQADSPLTPREREVLQALADGSSNKEVARALGMRPKTAAHHCAAIYSKLGVRGRTEAVTHGLARHLIRSSAPVG